MDVQIGDVWQCPIDFLDDSNRTYYRRGGRVELDRQYRLEHQNTEYQVLRLGKYRPAVVIGVEPDNNRYLAVPLYSLHDRAMVIPILQKQLSKRPKRPTRIYTCVEVEPAAVSAVTGKANERLLSDPSLARVDELRSLSRHDLDERLGRLEETVLRRIIAGLLLLGWRDMMGGILAEFDFQ